VGVRDANNNSLNTVPAVPPGTVCTLGPILRTLNLGAEGEDVRALQRFLNCRGFIVAQSGVGASGFETNYYGNLTQAAVIRFQNAYAAQILAPLNLVTGTGIFGERSRMHAMTLSNTR
jgi:peptidoglycan hydrolase-like protein with peptidoglycan-binding domain